MVWVNLFPACCIFLFQTKHFDVYLNYKIFKIWSGHKNSHRNKKKKSKYFSILNLMRGNMKRSIFPQLCNFENVHGNAVGSPKPQLPNSGMSLLSGLSFSLPPQRSTKEIPMANGTLEAQGAAETGRQQDRLVGRSAKQSRRESRQPSASLAARTAAPSTGSRGTSLWFSSRNNY